MRLALLVAATLTTSACGASIGDPAEHETGGADASLGSGGPADDASDTGSDTGSGSDVGSDAGGVTPAISGTEYVNDQIIQFCTAVFACKATYPTNATTSFADAYGASVTDCTSGYESYLGTSHVDGDVANGKIQFDPAAAAACLDGTTTPACTTFWQAGLTYPTACDTALAGTVASGGTCNSAYECASAQDVCPNRVCTTQQ